MNKEISIPSVPTRKEIKRILMRYQSHCYCAGVTVLCINVLARNNNIKMQMLLFVTMRVDVVGNGGKGKKNK
jgi:hypothetical protein